MPGRLALSSLSPSLPDLVVCFLVLPAVWATAAATAAASVDDTAVFESALVGDDQCRERGGDCVWSALQMRVQAGTSAASKVAWNCKSYGCRGYSRHHKCQCNAGCVRHGNCCSDYRAACETPGEVHGNPAHAHGKAPGGGHGHGAHAHGKVYGHPSKSKAYPHYAGFTLTLVEEFDRPLDLDSDPFWTWSDGGLREGQVRFVKENIRFEDGKMKIQVSPGMPSNTQHCSHAEKSILPPKKLSSGEMRSRHNMFRYGRYEASIKAPSVRHRNAWINGNYVATLFVFRDAKFRHWREIDVEITGDRADSLHTNVLWAEHADGWRAGMAEEGNHNLGTNLRSHFHTYAVEWLPQSITWFFDGKVIRRKRGGRLRIPGLSTKIMMNMWMFDDRALFGGKHIRNNRYPMQTEYDWFRFYRWKGDKHYPCAGMGTQCLSSDDKYLSSNNPCDGIPQRGTLHGKRPCVARCHRRHSKIG